MSRFDGAVALVTGAGSGIGAAVARRLAPTAPGSPASTSTSWRRRTTVPSLPGGVAVAVDVADSSAVDAAVAEVETTVGPIALVAHAAGVDADRGLKERLAEHRRALERGEGERGFRGVVELTDEQWDRVLRVNLDGTFYVVRAALRVMIPRRRGAIVTTASTAGMSGNAGIAHYSASKGGVRLFTQSVAREVAPFGIRVQHDRTRHDGHPDVRAHARRRRGWSRPRRSAGSPTPTSWRRRSRTSSATRPATSSARR